MLRERRCIDNRLMYWPRVDTRGGESCHCVGLRVASSSCTWVTIGVMTIRVLVVVPRRLLVVSRTPTVVSDSVIEV